MTSDGDSTRADTPAALATFEEGDATDTLATDPGRSSPSASLRPSAPSSTHAVTPEEALRQAEIARTRVFVPIVIGMAVIGCSLVAMLGGDPDAKLVMYGGAGLCVVACSYLYLLAGRPALYTEDRVGVVYLLCVFGIYATAYYFGLFSPVHVLVVLGLFFVGIGRTARISWMLFAAVIVCHAAFAGLILTDTMPDLGLMQLTTLELRDQIVVQVLIVLVYVVTFLIARSTKRESERAFVELDRAVRAVAQRDALLQEARLELARRVVGGPGRYSEQTVGGYRLGNLIGRGAMGEVYEAVHTQSGAEAALKLLHPAALEDPRRVTRFMREAEAAGKLDSEHVVKVLAVGDADAGGTPFIAMERLRGDDLASQLRDRRILPGENVVTLVREVGRAIDAARDAGIVHRDIKPQNLFQDFSGDAPRWKILDFGVSKLGGHGTLTQGQVVGTPVYMAPEQARGDDVDYRVDLYALAAVTYRALTGQPPFSGKDVAAILYNVVYKMPVRPSRVVDRLPDDIDRVLAIGMSKHPRDRFNTAADFADALAAALRSQLPAGLRDRAELLIRERDWRGG